MATAIQEDEFQGAVLFCGSDGPNGDPAVESAFRQGYLEGATQASSDEQWDANEDMLFDAQEARWRAKIGEADSVTLARHRGKVHGIDAAIEAWNAWSDAGATEEDTQATILPSWLSDLKRWAEGNCVEEAPPPRPPQSDEKPPGADPGEFPRRLLAVPGLIGQVVEHNLAGARRPQPLLALAGAICLQAVLVGRKVQDEYGTRPNLMIISVARTGRGKDWARTVNMEILDRAELPGLAAPEEFASDAGLFSWLGLHECCLWLCDEFGRYLATTTSAKHSPHLYAIPSALMRLFTSSAGVFRPKGYGDTKQNLAIDQPCLILQATSAPEQLYGALSSDNVADGFLGRCLIFEGDANPHRQMVPTIPIPAEITDAARWWGAYAPGGNLAARHPAPAVVPRTTEAKQTFNRFAMLFELRQNAGGRGADLWARAEEHAAKLALLYACSANRESPAIDRAAAGWACETVEHTIRRMVHLTNIWVSRNEQEGKQQKVLRIIRSAKDGIIQRDLSRATQWLKSRERVEILQGMLEAGLVRCNKVGQRVTWEAV